MKNGDDSGGLILFGMIFGAVVMFGVMVWLNNDNLVTVEDVDRSKEMCLNNGGIKEMSVGDSGWYSGIEKLVCINGATFKRISTEITK